MPVTTSEVEIGAWAALAQNAYRLWTIQNTSPNFAQNLYIDVALTDETACTGIGIIVLASSSAATNEFWAKLHESVVFGDDTASTEIADAEWTAGTKTLQVADLTGFVDNGIIPIFIKDNTIANSEVAWLLDGTTNGTDNLIIEHNLTRTHAVTTTLASTKCVTIPIEVPPGILRISGFIDNTQMGAAGPTAASRIRMSKVTAL